MSQLEYWQTVGQWEEFTAMHGSRQSQRTEQEQETMKIGQMMGGKYLKKDDCDPLLLLTIKEFVEENVAGSDQPEERKWVMRFSDSEKGLVMNTTNLQLAAIAFGSQDTDDWIGRQIVCFNDPSVSFGGKVTGGVRVRAPKKKAASKPVVPQEPDGRPVPFDDMDDDVPF